MSSFSLTGVGGPWSGCRSEKGIGFQKERLSPIGEVGKTEAAFAVSNKGLFQRGLEHSPGMTYFRGF